MYIFTNSSRFSVLPVGVVLCVLSSPICMYVTMHAHAYTCVYAWTVCVCVCLCGICLQLSLCLCAITFMSSLSVHACVPLFLSFLAPCVFVCPTAFKCVILFYLYVLSIFTYL